MVEQAARYGVNRDGTQQSRTNKLLRFELKKSFKGGKYNGSRTGFEKHCRIL